MRRLGKKNPNFKMSKGCDPMRFEVRMIFNSKVLIREAIKVYAMENKKKTFVPKRTKT
jgi:hypothetical protein